MEIEKTEYFTKKVVYEFQDEICTFNSKNVESPIDLIRRRLLKPKGVVSLPKSDFHFPKIENTRSLLAFSWKKDEIRINSLLNPMPPKRHETIRAAKIVGGKMLVFHADTLSKGFYIREKNKFKLKILKFAEGYNNNVHKKEYFLVAIPLIKAIKEMRNKQKIFRKTREKRC